VGEETGMTRAGRSFLCVITDRRTGGEACGQASTDERSQPRGVWNHVTSCQCRNMRGLGRLKPSTAAYAFQLLGSEVFSVDTSPPPTAVPARGRVDLARKATLEFGTSVVGVIEPEPDALFQVKAMLAQALAVQLIEPVHNDDPAAPRPTCYGHPAKSVRRAE
jgi:hypothetical protein